MSSKMKRRARKGRRRKKRMRKKRITKWTMVRLPGVAGRHRVVLGSGNAGMASALSTFDLGVECHWLCQCFIAFMAQKTPIRLG
jgi:hypothetical protein